MQSCFKAPLSRFEFLDVIVNTSATLSAIPSPTLELNLKGEQAMLLTVFLVGGAVWVLMLAGRPSIPSKPHTRWGAPNHRCAPASGNTDLLLKPRHNLIPPLVETVRG